MDCAKTNHHIAWDSLISDKSLVLVMLIATGVAFLPVGAWLAARTFDPSDEPWGLVALVTLLAFWLGSKKKISGANNAILSNSFLPALLMVAYAVSQIGGPMLVRAILAVSIVACLIAAASQSRFRLSHAALLIMSLPLLPSLQFFLGYPLRVAVAHTVAALVGVAGVTVDGTGLVYHGALIAIDAPCSGMRMLWTAMYLSLALSCIYGFSNWRAAKLSVIALVAAFWGNVMRAGSLVYGFHLASMLPPQLVVSHVGYSELPFYHDVIGAISFAIVVAVIAVSAKVMHARSLAGADTGGGTTSTSPLHIPLRLDRAPLPRRSVSFYLLAVLFAVAINCINIYAQDPAVRTGEEFGGWPQTFEGQALQPLTMTAWELKFAQNFPGRIAKFKAGNNQILMRWIKHESRQVHSVQDCLRGAGYTITPQMLMEKAGGERWAVFRAAKNGTSLAVRERISDGHGGAWTDVSEWYWAALTGKTRGPWLAQTVIQGQSEE